MRIASTNKTSIPFNEVHTNYVNRHGIYVPSVTTVIKVINKESLIYWANSLGWNKKSVKKELDTASTIGTYSHNIVESIIVNTSYKGLINEVKKFDNEKIKKICNSVNSFKSWWTINKEFFEIIDIEKSLVCDEYGGTVDIICKYKGKLVILDLKTSSDFYFNMFIQLAAYAHLYYITTGELIEDVGILRLNKKNGNEAELLMMSELPGNDMNYYYTIYNRALDLYRYLHVLEADWEEFKNNKKRGILI